MTTPAAPVAAGLLERDHELEQLRAAIAAATAGAGAVVALEGEACLLYTSDAADE